MSKIIGRESIEAEDEKKILISCITNTDFLKTILTFVELDHFKVYWSKTIFQWVKDYFEKYEEAPQKTIQDIYNFEKKRLGEEEGQIIGIFLSNLSQLYEDGFSSKYYIDKAEKYLRRRSLELHTEKVSSLLRIGKIDEAEVEQANFKRVVAATSDFINPHDPEYIRRTFENQDKNRLIKLPGKIGDLIGWLNRGWLVIIQAPFKVGKSHMLQEFRRAGLLARKKVIDFNFEMTHEQLSMRHWRGITGLSSDPGMSLYPMFDCHWNQIGECDRSFRKSKIRLFNPEKSNSPPPFEKAPKNYVICTECRNHRNEEYRGSFKLATWFESFEAKEMTQEAVVRKAMAISRQFGNILRMKSFPRGSAHVGDLERYLDILEYSEGFIPDVLLVDYPKIMGVEPDARKLNEEGQFDKTMMRLSGLAHKRGCLVVAPTQVKTEVLSKRGGKSKMGDASQSARAIYAHAEAGIGMAQTPEEKQMGIVRINVVFHRHDKFNELIEAMTLSQLDIGQFITDSDIDGDW